MTLNDGERAVLATIIMRLSEEEALAYLKGKDYSMEKSTYYTIKGKIRGNTFFRLGDIAKDYLELHSERIGELEFIRTEMWRNYHMEKSPYKKVLVLEKIKDIQPFLSAYYEATRYVMEEHATRMSREISDHMPGW